MHVSPVAVTTKGSTTSLPEVSLTLTHHRVLRTPVPLSFPISASVVRFSHETPDVVVVGAPRPYTGGGDQGRWRVGVRETDSRKGTRRFRHRGRVRTREDLGGGRGVVWVDLMDESRPSRGPPPLHRPGVLPGSSKVTPPPCL